MNDRRVASILASDENDVEVVGPETLKLSKKGEDGALTLRRVK